MPYVMDRGLIRNLPTWAWVSCLLALAVAQRSGAQTGAPTLFSGLSENDLYNQIESLYLAGAAAPEMEACAAFLQQYPQSPYAPKVEYRQVVAQLHEPADWQASIDGLQRVGRDYPATPFAALAQQIHDALTSPTTAGDVELIVQQYRVTAEPVPAGQAEAHPLTEAFFILRLLSFYDRLPLLDWIKADPQMVDSEKSLLAYYIAEMMYRAPLQNYYGQCQDVCKWIVQNYPSETYASALTLRLLGTMKMVRLADLAGAESALRQIADDPLVADLKAGCFCQLGHYQFLAGNYASARRLLDEVRTAWPDSQAAYEAYGIEARREIVETCGAPAPLTHSESVWASAGEAPLNQAGGTTATLASRLRRGGSLQLAAQSDCGPYALWLVCRRLGLPCTLAEAGRRCPARPGGVSSFLDLYRALPQLGLKVQALEVGLAQLRELAADQESGVILHLPNHFKVLSGADTGLFKLADQSGVATVSERRLGFLWDGYVLVARRERPLAQPAGAATPLVLAGKP